MKALVKIQNKCEVLESNRKRANLKLRVQGYQCQSESKLESDRPGHQYRLEERKYALGMKN